MIRVRVDQLFLSNMGFVVLLREAKSERSLPIFIGAAEAQAIAIRINKLKIPRPLTHDLLKNVLDFMECRVKRIEVSDLRDGTFFARLFLERDGKEMEIDSRPSDAIALALRTSAPIYVAENVMKEAGRVFKKEDLDRSMAESKTDRPKSRKREKPQKELTPLEALQRDLDRAVEDERYEDAARLRDEILRLKQSHTDN